MIRGCGGVFWPQNAEYSNTKEIVRKIAKISGHKILISSTLNFLITLALHMPGKVKKLVNKALGNMSYDHKMSKYDFDYQVVTLEESIKKTEG